MIVNQNTSFTPNTFMNSVNEIPKIKNQILNNTNSENSNTTTASPSPSKTTINNTVKNNKPKTNNITKTAIININTWKLVIKAIGLEAEIADGTSQEVMNKYIGHFENTSIWDGNIGLAAHNRGYPVNYFANIKNLKTDDIIEYYHNGNVRKYKVKIVTIIPDTDWTYLSNTNDNRITLITCVENEPEYRRCIQGIEI